MKSITQFLAERGLDLAAVRSHADDNDSLKTQSILLAINIPDKINLLKLEQGIHELAESMSLECSIKRMQGIAAP